MAERPVFLPGDIDEGRVLVREVTVSFEWHPGMAPSRKRMNVASLHEAAHACSLSPLLEVSTKGDNPLGQRLSAFNLTVDTPETGEISVESAFQGSKVFTRGGPFTDLYGMSGRQVKSDQRLRTSGSLLRFEFAGERWGLQPVTAFYDWLYLRALKQHPELGAELPDFAGFTDIEFNPKRSLNCQARSCALYVALVKSGRLEQALADKDAYLGTVGTGQQLSL